VPACLSGARVIYEENFPHTAYIIGLNNILASTNIRGSLSSEKKLRKVLHKIPSKLQIHTILVQLFGLTFGNLISVHT
jgi:hypothetical protein